VWIDSSFTLLLLNCLQLFVRVYFCHYTVTTRVLVACSNEGVRFVKYSCFNKLPGLMPKGDKETVLHTEQAKREQDTDCGLVKDTSQVIATIQIFKSLSTLANK